MANSEAAAADRAEAKAAAVKEASAAADGAEAKPAATVKKAAATKSP